MSLLADAFQPFVVPGLLKIQGRPLPSTLADLIGKQGILGFDLNFDDADEVIITDFREPTPVLTALASDCSRLASASFQTIGQLGEDMAMRDRLAWGVIQAYYAAFYAGHAILRIVGESCSHFDSSHISRIKNLGIASGRVPGFKLPVSVYHCVLDPSATVVRSSSLREGSGGEHAAFWKTFGLRLRKMSEDVLLGSLGQEERQTVFNKLEDLRQNISFSNSSQFNHLSNIRNEVQYRHARDVWLPSSLHKTDREQIGRLIGQWKRDPMNVDLGSENFGILGRFAVTCAFLVSLCFSLLMRISERSQNPSRSFARLGPLALGR